VLIRRSDLKRFTHVALIAVACWNIQAFTVMVLRLPPREVNNPVGWETQWDPIQKQLTLANYRNGKLGYVTARSLRGEAASEQELTSWAELRYTVVPFDLVFNKSDAPFIVGDFAPERPAALPPGLSTVYDSGSGLVLLRSTATR
jgi:hypothetical protein